MTLKLKYELNYELIYLSLVTKILSTLNQIGDQNFNFQLKIEI